MKKLNFSFGIWFFLTFLIYLSYIFAKTAVEAIIIIPKEAIIFGETEAMLAYMHYIKK
jgi:hypothetical protein